ncbi:hypothetical protein PIB30_025284 [Stylosanthes scabra]|uniref:Uncharacterized protein n=1 Tax=Stylosanthes scabra TaxID=79078 RepID=A0ABU6U9Z0_9FABA|nr:hypothetical protein [Stylosanthes scabra]
MIKECPGRGLKYCASLISLLCPRSDKLSPRRNTPPKSAVNNLVLKELVEPTFTRPTARIPLITVVIPCRRALTLASRGVQIAVTDLTPFLPIQTYGGLAAKVICTFHPTAETLCVSPVIFDYVRNN